MKNFKDLLNIHLFDKPNIIDYKNINKLQFKKQKVQVASHQTDTTLQPTSALTDFMNPEYLINKKRSASESSED